MNKNDLRVKRTRSHLETAMNLLLRKKSINEITIKELTELAEISRQTFYKHYDTKEELYLVCAENFFLSLNTRIKNDIEKKKIELLEEKFTYVFDIYRDEISTIKIYMSVENKDLIMRSLDKANVLMIEAFGAEMDYKDKQLVIDMLSGLVYVMLRKWIERKDHSDKEIIHAIYSFFSFVSK